MTEVEATIALPPGVEAVLGGPAPAPPERWLVEAPTLPWSIRGWGSGRPVLLLHGVTSSSLCWWRLGPGLAAAGYGVVAPDLPGHGETPPPPAVRSEGALTFTFADGAALVAELVEELRLPVPDLAVVGHSWGAIVAANLPAVGVRPRHLVLLDPPVCDEAWATSRAADVRRPASREEALAMALESLPGGAADDLGEKAEALLHLDAATARSVFISAPWDGGLAALAAADGAVAAGVATWVIRADPAAGGYVPDEALPRFVALLGPDRVLTVPGSAHSLHRSHPRETLAAILRALGS